MPAPGAKHGIRYGNDYNAEMVVVTSASTVSMATTSAGCCLRWRQRDTRKVYSVVINWSSVSSPGTVRCTIETVDGTNGKPTGTLWDANATIDFTPTAGWQVLTFASAPTTAMTAGTDYAVVLDQRTGGSTALLNAYYTDASKSGAEPAVVSTTSTVGTRSSFAEVAASIPLGSLIYDDSVEESNGWCPYQGYSSINLFSTTNSGGSQIIVPTNITLTVWGYYWWFPLKNGTPAGDVTFKLWDNAGNAVANSSVTLDKDIIAGGTQRRMCIPLDAPLSLTAGTYYLVGESQGSANSSNCWTIRSATARNSSMQPADFQKVTSANINGSPPTFTLGNTGGPTVGLILDDLSGAAGGAGVARLVGGSLAI